MNNSSEHLFLFFFKISDLIIFFQNVITGAHIHRSPFLSLTYTSQDPINNGYREPRPRSTLFSITCPQFLFENLLHSDVIQYRKNLFILLFHSYFKCPSVRTYLDSILGVNLNVILLSWSSLIHQYFGCCQIYSHCWTTARSDKLIMVIYLDWIFHFIAGPFTAFILLLEVFWTTHNLWWWIIVHKKSRQILSQEIWGFLILNELLFFQTGAREYLWAWETMFKFSWIHVCVLFLLFSCSFYLDQCIQCCCISL